MLSKLVFKDEGPSSSTIMLCKMMQVSIMSPMCCGDQPYAGPHTIAHRFCSTLSERKSLAGWRSAPTLNPKMRRDLSVLLVVRFGDEHKNTQEFRVVRAVGA